MTFANPDTWYVSDNVCKNGHQPTRRYKKSHHCVDCTKEKNDRHREANPSYRKTTNMEYRKTNTLKARLNQAKDRARKIGVPFALTVDDIKDVPETCPVLGIPMYFSVGKGFSDRENSPSLDRLIPELGYVPGNVRWISFRANAIRRDATASELQAVADYARKIEEEYGTQAQTGGPELGTS